MSLLRRSLGSSWLSAARVAAMMTIAVSLPDRSEACACVQAGPACQDFWNADAVFVGRVESVARADADQVITFVVQESFRGTVTGSLPSGQVLTIRTPASPACGYSFRTGRQYLVYASRVQGRSDLTTDRCTRTQPLERAFDDLSYIRTVSSGAGSPGRIFGSAVLRTRDLIRHRDRDHPLADLVLLLTSADFVARVTTDVAGNFELRGAPEGHYTAAVEPRSGVAGPLFPSEFDVKDTRACVQLSAVMRSTAVVRGRLVNATGAAVPGVTIELTVPAGLDQNPGPERLRTLTRRDGTFEVDGIGPGRYVLGINTMPGFTPRLIYPGVESVRAATIVPVRAGVSVDLTDFVIPAYISFVQIPGVVLDSAGAPAVGARVFLAGPSDGDRILSAPAITDESGRFVLSAAAGQQYRIFAERPYAGSQSSRVDATDVISVTAAPHLALHKLSLRPLH
jgi:carboxypeptidase family protein